MKRLRVTMLALLVSMLAIGPGCNRYAWEMFADVAITALTVAAVLAVHDAHHHHAHCGHAYVYYEGQHVYDYDGRWEYYDARDGRWYYYPDGLPHHRYR